MLVYLVWSAETIIKVIRIHAPQIAEVWID